MSGVGWNSRQTFGMIDVTVLTYRSVSTLNRFRSRTWRWLRALFLPNKTVLKPQSCPYKSFGLWQQFQIIKYSDIGSYFTWSRIRKTGKFSILFAQPQSANSLPMDFGLDPLCLQRTSLSWQLSHSLLYMFKAFVVKLSARWGGKYAPAHQWSCSGRLIGRSCSIRYELDI